MPASRRTQAGPSLALLRRLCNAVGVSGDEGEIRKIILDELKPAAGTWHVDALGNLLITRTGRGAGRLRVMVDAHMDEVGFMLVADSGDGLYEFEKVGGLDPRGMAGKRVVVGRQHTPGVVGTKAIHLLSQEDLKRPISTEGLRVDLGPGGKASVGDRGTFAPNFARLGPSIMSKALDDRLGVSILIELLRHAPANIDLLAAFSVQEELGLRGAQVAANYFEPDAAIALDATPARDLPMQHEGENASYNSKLGLGPAIYVSNSTTIDDRRLVDFMVDTARRQKMPFQIRQPGGGGTDAGAIQRSVEGVPVVSMSVPHRYTHSPLSLARIADWQNTYALALAALRRMQPGILKRKR